MRSGLLKIWCGAAALTLAGAAWANPPMAVFPREENTGFSSIEQKWVYGTPDEGSFTVPLVPGAGPNEVFVRDLPMCEGSAELQVNYSKSQNKVRIRAEFDALPYRPSFTRSVDISNQWNIHPVQVEDGKWQIWTIGKLFAVPVTLWYDGPSGQLLGTEFDFPTGGPPFSFPVVYPMAQMVCSPIFEGDPDGHAVVEWEWDYDQMLDGIGSGGVIAGFIPENICQPDHLIAYYTNGGLPPEMAMNWDEVLDNIHTRGIMFATSLEPDPKPEYLLARDNLMIAHLGAYPQVIPDGYTMELNGFTLQELDPDTCTASVELGDWQGPYYDFCSGS